MTQEERKANIAPHKFLPGVSGNPGGRPKNRVKPMLAQAVSKKRLKEVDGFSDCEIATMERSLLAMTLPELQAVAKSDTLPAYLKGKAIAVITDMKNGRSDTLDRLRDRQYGREPTRFEVTGRDGLPLAGVVATLTPDQARDYLRDLDEQY